LSDAPEDAAPILNPACTIGIRDSGVGGLTVARRIRQVLPHARLLYFADTAHVPYGSRAPHEVRHFALSISQFLIERGADILVFACNTSSACALDAARQRFSVPVVGTIEPGARAATAISSSGRIGVLATQATVESGVYSQWIERLRPDAQCLEIACPAFVPLVENKRTCSDEARDAGHQYLRPLLDASCDTVVLGCTHYPLLLPVLQEAARDAGVPDMRFVDPAEAVADAVQTLVAQLPASPLRAAEPPADSGVAGAGDIFFVSGPDDGLRHWIDKLLPSNGPPNIQSGPVFDLPWPHEQDKQG
jgi:glutamate racemase